MNPDTTKATLDRLNIEHINLIAAACASKIVGDGWAAASLTPGDMTGYYIVVTPAETMVEDPPGDCTWETLRPEWVVSIVVPEAGSYFWTGKHDVDPGYVADHWRLGDWTAVVLTTFLNALATHMQDA